MLQYDFEESIGYWVCSTSHLLQVRLNEQLSEHGITFRQWEVLVWISFSGECSQSELAQRMQIEAPTLVGVLDRMERDGWIERVPDHEDRRKKQICLTAQVQPVWDKMVECARQVRSEAIQGISEADLHKVRDVLGKVRENLTGETATERQMQPRMESTS